MSLRAGWGRAGAIALLAACARRTPDTGAGRCPAGMAEISGGAFPMEGGVAAIDPFCLDQTEVTTAAYGACAARGLCPPAFTTVDWPGITEEVRARESVACNAGRPDRADHPMNCVDFRAATAFCGASGKRLPTEPEWEWSARGQSAGHEYPWGGAPPDGQLCWSGASPRDGTCASASFPAGDAPGGLHDLAGNVWEWTSSRPDARADAGARVYRGGGWNSRVAKVVRAAYRGEDPEAARSSTLGFRCATRR